MRTLYSRSLYATGVSLTSLLTSQASRHHTITSKMRLAPNIATGLAALAVNIFPNDNKVNNNNKGSPAGSFLPESPEPPSYTASTCDLICRSRIVYPVVYSSATIGISMVMTAQNSWDWCNENSEMCKSSITSTCNMISEKLVADSRPNLLEDKCDDNCLLKELELASQKAAYWAMDWAIGGINGTMTEDDEEDLMTIKERLRTWGFGSRMAEIITTKDLLFSSWPQMFEEKLPIGGENWNGVTGDAIMLMAKFFDPESKIPGSIDDMILLPGKWLNADSSGFAKMWQQLATSRAADVRHSWLGKMARAVYEVVQRGDVKPREQFPSIHDDEDRAGEFPTWTGPSGISPKDFMYMAGRLSGEKWPGFDAVFSRPRSVFEKRGVNPGADEIFMVEKYDVHSNTHYSRYCMDAAAPGEVRGDYRRWVEVDGQGIPTTQPPTHFWLHKNQLKKVTRDDFKDMDVSKDVDAGEGPSTHNVDALNQPAVAVEDKLASNYELVAEQAVDKLRVAIVSLSDAKGKKPAKFNLPELLISSPIFRSRSKVAYNVIKKELKRIKDQHQQPDPKPSQPDLPHPDPAQPEPPSPNPPGPPPLPPAPPVNPPSLPDAPSLPDPPAQPQPQPQPNPPCDPPTNCHPPPSPPEPPVIPEPPSPPKPASPKIPPIIPPIIPIPGHHSDDHTSTSRTHSLTSYATPATTKTSSQVSSSSGLTGFGLPPLVLPVPTSHVTAVSGSASGVLPAYGMNRGIGLRCN
ncbi:hypothetical protein HII31_06531 [Pseudocercospora fuligena]|uniref:Uncharacterized protein n=1 Tax=Pseudocercospora fuligena TaxID=685502 RepID=A0A8H6VHW0_9PEZI|nr:hypothetical protein HII31_06531 [Pseudocercospora fuligena]